MERRILIGNKLRAARKQLGMSQTDLGKVRLSKKSPYNHPHVAR